MKINCVSRSWETPESMFISRTNFIQKKKNASASACFLLIYGEYTLQISSGDTNGFYSFFLFVILPWMKRIIFISEDDFMSYSGIGDSVIRYEFYGSYMKNKKI